MDRNRTEIRAPDPLVGWRAWYRDDRVYDGKLLDDWRALPKTGLLYVVLQGADWRVPIHSRDWVWWDGETWGGVMSKHGGNIWLPRPEGLGDTLKRGEHVQSDEWLRVKAEAEAWPGKREGMQMKIRAKLGQVALFDRSFMEKVVEFEDGVADVPERVGKELCKRYPESFGAVRAKVKKENDS